MNTHTPLRAAIYARVPSTHETDRANSLQAQLTSCTTFAQVQGYRIVSVYQDTGASGLYIDHPDLTRLRQAVQHGDIEIIVVHDLIRLTRDLSLLVQLLDEFRQAGVYLRCVQGDGAVEIDSPPPDA